MTCQFTKSLTTATLALSLAAPSQAEVSVDWFSFSVAAISSTSADPVHFFASLAGSPTSARIDLTAGGSVDLSPIGGGVWQATLTADQVLTDYTTAKVNHNFVGYLRCFEGATQALQINVFINVVDENVPEVVPVLLDPDTQRACRVANYWLPDLTYPPPFATYQQITSSFYADFGDDYDFVNILFVLPSFPENRGYVHVRNEVSGIGLLLSDNTAHWGSAGRLFGVVIYPIDHFFDLAAKAAVHEIGHKWINFCDYPPLATGVPHWPLGTQARGVMGYSLLTGAGGDFNYDLLLQPNGDYRMVTAEPLYEFTDLDLYLMGFLPPDSVGVNFVFSDPDQPICHGCEGPVTHFGINDVVGAQGARSPSWPNTPHDFRVATIIATRDRLLTAEEMAFFDYFAARGEAQIPLPFTSGFTSGMTKPFFVATGERGTLETTLLPICDNEPPTVEIVLNRHALWPPNHKLVDIQAMVTVTDDVDPDPDWWLESITSNEPDDGTGDGDCPDDIQDEETGTPDTEYRLRAERAGCGSGRVYTITYGAMDDVGNISFESAEVRVPHSRRGGAVASIGFEPDGRSLDTATPTFALIVTARLGDQSVAAPLAARQIVTSEAYVGNTAGALRPVASRWGDFDADGLEDVALFYERETTLAIAARSDELDGPLALNYFVADGPDYNVPDIFALGEPVDLDGAATTGVASQPLSEGAVPVPFGITAVHPNPFGPSTEIAFALRLAGVVRLEIFDTRGARVRSLVNTELGPGFRAIEWNGRDDRGRRLASGVYFARLWTSEEVATRKIVMLR